MIFLTERFEDGSVFRDTTPPFSLRSIEIDDTFWENLRVYHRIEGAILTGKEAGLISIEFS